MFASVNTNTAGTSIESLMKRCWEADLIPQNDLSGLQSMLAADNNLPIVTAVEIEALLDARDATARVVYIGSAIPLVDRFTQATLTDAIEAWEASLQRCIRDFVWAEKLGIYTETYAEARTFYVEPLFAWVRNLRNLTPDADGRITISPSEADKFYRPYLSARTKRTNLQF